MGHKSRSRAHSRSRARSLAAGVATSNHNDFERCSHALFRGCFDIIRSRLLSQAGSIRKLKSSQCWIFQMLDVSRETSLDDFSIALALKDLSQSRRSKK
jgi:hypothetical protein